jgi:hypothetical protein
VLAERAPFDEGDQRLAQVVLAAAVDRDRAAPALVLTSDRQVLVDEAS